MTSKQKKKIARRNGAQAAGTKSPAGLHQSSQNSLKHGLTGKSLVLSNESQAKFDELRQDYVSQFNPRTPVERDLVDDMVACRWRLKRIRVLQAAAIDLQMDRMEAEIQKSFDTIDQPTRTVLAVGKLANEDNTLDLLHRYEISYSRMYNRALKALMELQKTNLRNDPNPEPPDPARAQLFSPPPAPESFEPDISPLAIAPAPE